MLVTPNLDKADCVCRNGVKHFVLRAQIVKQEILPGVFMLGYGYNGSIPGPTIQVYPGDTVNIRLHNDLPEPTTLNVTGLDTPNPLDGVADVEPSPLIDPGSYFDYRYKVPNYAGSHMYRPGVNNIVQQNKGMAGMLIVTNPNNNPQLDYGLMLQEFKLLDARSQLGSVAASAQVSQSLPTQSAVPQGTYNIDPYSENPNFFTINGKCYPYLTPLRVVPGANCRIRMCNASSCHSQPMHIFGHAFNLCNIDGFPIKNESNFICCNTCNVACGQTRECIVVCANPGIWPLSNEVPKRKTNNMASPLGGMTTVLDYQDNGRPC